MRAIRVHHTVLLAALLAAPVAGAACARGASQGQPGGEPAPAKTPAAAQAELIVENASSGDMDIYLVGRAQRVRLGLAPANRTTRFTVSDPLAAGSGFVRFVAVPINALGEGVGTDPVSVHPGDRITLRVPPS